ncbi:MAG: RNA polymerase sigma-70 factor [Bacteroidetes bacterium]|nr:RNA polymerase sigma-70 factor [Bacteroidota bacterium]
MFSLQDYTDQQLLELIARDDETAFTELYHRYWEGLFITAAKALRNKTEAGDVVQDIFLSLWKRRHELKIEGTLTSYLHSAIRYKVINYISKDITRYDYLALLADVSVNWLPPDAEVSLQLKELHRAVNNVVIQMPPKMQQVYKLSRQDQLSHKEIADKLSLSVETVKKHIQHALQLIKTRLQYASVILSFIFSFVA